WREDQPQRNDRPEIGHKAGRQDSLAILGSIESKFEHHRIDNGHRGRRHGDPREQARHPFPTEDVVGGSGAAQKWAEEAGKANSGRLSPFQFEHRRIELGAGQKRQDDGTETGQEFHPGLVSPENRVTNHGPDDELCDCPDYDFGKRSRYPKPDREQARNQCEAEPQGRQCPDTSHFALLTRKDLASALLRKKDDPPRAGAHWLHMNILLLAQNALQESSAGMAVLGDSIPVVDG